MGTDKGEGAAHGGDLSYDGVVSSLGRSEPVPVTSEMINALPEPVRRFIHDLETRCDPAGDVQTIASLTEQRSGLLKQVKELQGELAAWRTLALDNTDVPGMQDDIEEDGAAILRLKLERLELVSLRSAAIDAFTRPYFINATANPPLDDKLLEDFQDVTIKQGFLGILSAVGSRPLTLTPARLRHSSDHEGEVLGTPMPPLALDMPKVKDAPLLLRPPKRQTPGCARPAYARPWAGSLVVRATMEIDAKTGEMVAVEGGPPPERK